MVKTAEKTELNQISLTGIRALVMIGLLIKRPHSFEEIKNTFINLKIMDKSHSDDIVRIDLNTIKLMGCKIERCSAKTNFKYVLTKHPFAFNISNEELKIVKKVYNVAKQNVDLDTLIEYHDMFERIAKYICDEETKEAVLGISVLKYYNIQEIKDLIIDSKNKATLDLFYKKTNSDSAYRKQIVLQEVVCKNDKIYLYGYDLNKKAPTVLHLLRVESIISKTYEKQNFEKKQIIVRFNLKNFDINDLSSNETIVENKENIYTVEGVYHNSFLAIQRMLSFGNKCTVLEPNEIKKDIIKKIKEMRKIYGC